MGATNIIVTILTNTYKSKRFILQISVTRKRIYIDSNLLH